MALSMDGIIAHATGGGGTREIRAGLEAAGIDVTPEGILAVKDAQARARRLQEVWAVASAGRALELVRGGDVAGPKGLEGQVLRLGPEPQQVAKFVGPSMALVRVVKADSSSLSRAIRARRAAGLSVVPTRL
jgi:hypothetical protein